MYYVIRYQWCGAANTDFTIDPVNDLQILFLSSMFNGLFRTDGYGLCSAPGIGKKLIYASLDSTITPKTMTTPTPPTTTLATPTTTTPTPTLATPKTTLRRTTGGKLSWRMGVSRADCDTGAGEVYMAKSSPGKVSSLDACKKSCEAALKCQSIAYFRSGWCSHYSTPCTKTQRNSKAVGTFQRIDAKYL